MAKKKHKKDPFAAREAATYSNPIASREYILELWSKDATPLSFNDIKSELKIKQKERQIALKRRLRAMVRDGQLERTRRRKYIPVGQRDLIEGRVAVDNNGSLWCIPSVGGSKVLISRHKKYELSQGDKIIVAVPQDDSKVKTGRVIEILAKSQGSQIVGRLIKERANYFVVPFGREVLQDILIPKTKLNKAKENDIVLVKTQPKYVGEDVVGHIVKVMGAANAKGVEIATMAESYQLPYRFSADILAEVKDMESPEGRNYRSRVSLEKLPFVTIDGEDAKDFDDAVYCEAKPRGGFKLFVAIADVSHYITKNSELDQEAQERGNSVYFPGKVIPMLPERLSNDLCSLKPGVNRLALVCEMSVSAAGSVTRYKFFPAVICSAARLTYTEVAAMLADDVALQQKYAALLPFIQQLHDLYKVLAAARKERGALDFDSVETKIIFNNKGKIKKIEPVARNVAHKIIEECMLCANVATARFLAKNKIPCLYRIHEPPPQDKLQELNKFLRELGLALQHKGEITSIAYSDLLKRISRRQDYAVIQTVLLRSLSQAVYSPDNIGHFGLAYSSYTHFTSPIRRYPDLIVHRLIKKILTGRWQPPTTKEQQQKAAKQQEKLDKIAAHCSFTERRADDAVRDVERWLKCQYIAQHLGETFLGVISGINSFGFFVQLEKLFVDGLVHVNNLKADYFCFDPVTHTLRGERSGIEYTLGMQVTVRIASVDIDSRKIDFELITPKKKSKAKNSKKKKKK